MKIIKPSPKKQPNGTILYKVDSCPLTCYATNKEGMHLDGVCCLLVVNDKRLGVGEVGCEEDEC
jgi:hypothetical protein